MKSDSCLPTAHCLGHILTVVCVWLSFPLHREGVTLEWCWPLSRLLAYCHSCGLGLNGHEPRAYWKGQINNVWGGWGVSPLQEGMSYFLNQSWPGLIYKACGSGVHICNKYAVFLHERNPLQLRQRPTKHAVGRCSVGQVCTHLLGEQTHSTGKEARQAQAWIPEAQEVGGKGTE